MSIYKKRQIVYDSADEEEDTEDEEASTTASPEPSPTSDNEESTSDITESLTESPTPLPSSGSSDSSDILSSTPVSSIISSTLSSEPGSTLPPTPSQSADQQVSDPSMFSPQNRLFPAAVAIIIASCFLFLLLVIYILKRIAHHPRFANDKFYSDGRPPYYNSQGHFGYYNDLEKQQQTTYQNNNSSTESISVESPTSSESLHQQQGQEQYHAAFYYNNVYQDDKHTTNSHRIPLDRNRRRNQNQNQNQNRNINSNSNYHNKSNPKSNIQKVTRSQEPSSFITPVELQRRRQQQEQDVYKSNNPTQVTIKNLAPLPPNPRHKQRRPVRS